MRKDVHMAPFRSIFLLFTCLCLLLTTACTAKPISDKSALCAGAICDDASFLYCVRNREVWKIDKATYTVSATGLPAMCICYADGALYRLYEETLYRNDEAIATPQNGALWDTFVTGSFGCWLSSSILNRSYLCAKPGNTGAWEETADRFPVIDNHGDLRFIEIRKEGGSFVYIMDAIPLYTEPHGFTPYNDRFFLYNGNVYFTVGEKLYVVSLQSGQKTEKPYNADEILAVGHDAIYFRYGDQLLRESISSGDMSVCTSALSDTADFYVDSYQDTVYILSTEGETVSCSAAAFQAYTP